VVELYLHSSMHLHGMVHNFTVPSGGEARKPVVVLQEQTVLVRWQAHQADHQCYCEGREISEEKSEPTMEQVLSCPRERR
jgi:hypothetical protein